jgi:cytochrome c
MDVLSWLRDDAQLDHTMGLIILHAGVVVRMCWVAVAIGLCAGVAACSQDAPVPVSGKIELPVPSSSGLQNVSALPRPYANGDAVKGRVEFVECAACHSLVANGSNDKGPTLYGVYGRAAATKTDFVYSEALRNSHFVWDLNRLDQWLFNPHEALPGTTMAYIGIRSDARRYNVIAYLVSLRD